MIQNIQDQQCNINYAKREMIYQQNIWDNVKNNNKNLNNYHDQINSDMDKIIETIIKYISSNFKSTSLNKEVKNELCKIKEGCFKENKADTCFYSIWNEYISSVDKIFTQVIKKYFVC